MDPQERAILERLDAALRRDSARAVIDGIVARVEQALDAEPDSVMAWEPIPLECYARTLPGEIRSNWVFILRARTATGAERHPNSHQRMISYRGAGDFQTRPGSDWCSHHLTSDPDAPLEQRWISIPRNVWHQAVVSGRNWVVVSFQTAAADELIEERPDAGDEGIIRRRRYID
jgi:hypothetical protein